jgi:hypothetical protein
MTDPEDLHQMTLHELRDEAIAISNTLTLDPMTQRLALILVHVINRIIYDPPRHTTR